MLTLQALMNIDRRGRNGWTIWKYAKGTLTPSKGPDSVLNWIALSISTAEKFAPKQVVKQLENGKASTIQEVCEWE